jgi:hypothetical protein
VQDEPRELREPLEQVGERVELPHDLDVAPAFELEDQINRPVTDDLVRDADSVLRRRIERVRDARHPPTLSDWSSEAERVREAVHFAAPVLLNDARRSAESMRWTWS